MDPVKAIHAFWFGDLATLPERYPEQKAFWFQQNPQTDRAINLQFEPMIEPIANGEQADWLKTPQGYLASILCLDQFTRNCYRDTPKAFAYDPQALQLALTGIEMGIDQSLQPYEQMFFYLPLEHAEDLAMQEQMLSLATSLLTQATPESHPHMADYLSYAEQHHAIIQRFGRFPHRNKILRRTSTPEELEFLETPNSAF